MRYATGRLYWRIDGRMVGISAMFQLPNPTEVGLVDVDENVYHRSAWEVAHLSDEGEHTVH